MPDPTDPQWPNVSRESKLCRSYCVPGGFMDEKSGDVFRCEHGRIFICSPTGWVIDGKPRTGWRPMTRWLVPFKYRRAVRALDEAEANDQR